MLEHARSDSIGVCPHHRPKNCESGRNKFPAVEGQAVESNTLPRMRKDKSVTAVYTRRPWEIAVHTRMLAMGR